MTDQVETNNPSETRRLYFEDVYRREFDAAVLETLVREEKPAVVLDQTCFYPESGGQPADRGTLGGASVVHVFEVGQKIVHVLDKEIGAPSVHGVIDWALRFDHMQQHSGQHILSQCFVECLGGETKSFHLGDFVSTLEIGLSVISDTELAAVECRANEIVTENREILTYFVSEDKIETVPLRRPPKKSGPIRVVEVNGFDYSACGGTHCRRTGEIGLIKIIRTERIRNNNRFEFLCGNRAVRDYEWKNRAVVSLAARLSVQERDVFSAVEKLAAEMKDSRKELRKLREALAGFQAQDMIGKAGGPVIRAVWTDRTPEEAKLLALSLIRTADVVVLFGVRGPDRDHLIFASTERLPVSMKNLVPVALTLVQGKGGGSSSLVELVVAKGGDLEAVLDAAAAYTQQKLSSP
jgi:alanyl-tRNA synthetase